MFENPEAIPETVALAFTIGAFLLGLLIGHSQGARHTARKIAWKIHFREDIDLQTRAQLSDEIIEEYKYA